MICPGVSPFPENPIKKFKGKICRFREKPVFCPLCRVSLSFVRSMSDGLKFGLVRGFSSFVGICSGCCAFVRLWGFCAFVLGVLSFPVAVFPSVAVGFWAWLWCTSSAAFPGCFWVWFPCVRLLFSVCLLRSVYLLPLSVSLFPALCACCGGFCFYGSPADLLTV